MQYDVWYHLDATQATERENDAALNSTPFSWYTGTVTSKNLSEKHKSITEPSFTKNTSLMTQALILNIFKNPKEI
jgi:hypothetical protein